MALTRKMLKGMGIDDEKIDLIIEAHTEAVDGLKDELKTAKADADKLPDVQKELDDLKAKGNDGWKDKHDKLQGEFDTYKKGVEAKETRSAKEKAYRDILKDANLSEKGIEKAIKYAEWDKLELEEDGKLKDASEHVKSVKEEWSEYVTTTNTAGANTTTPPANNGGNSVTRSDIMKISDSAARQKAIAENINNFKGVNK